MMDRVFHPHGFMPKKESLAKLASFFEIGEQFLLNFDA